MALYSLFAEILGYPECPIGKAVNDCMAELVAEFPATHAHIADFQNAVAGEVSASSRRPIPTPSICVPIARPISDITCLATTAGGVSSWRS